MRIPTKAVWVQKRCIILDDVFAVRGDPLEIHGQYSNGGSYIVKGIRFDSYFWVKPEDIEITEYKL